MKSETMYNILTVAEICAFFVIVIGLTRLSFLVRKLPEEDRSVVSTPLTIAIIGFLLWICLFVIDLVPQS